MARWKSDALAEALVAEGVIPKGCGHAEFHLEPGKSAFLRFDVFDFDVAAVSRAFARVDEIEQRIAASRAGGR